MFQKTKTVMIFLVIVAMSAGGGVVHAVDMDFVVVRDVGNNGEWSGEGAGGFGPDRVCGAVGGIYGIGRFEVTAGQYTEFLNAVAGTDTHGLYHPGMWNDVYPCGIERTGTSGDYHYAVEPDWANRPVNFVDWGDAARFCNWLTNGQPVGPQTASTTEDGSYALNGATSVSQLQAVVRHPDARYVIPSEDEWYKAAYYDADSASYHDYATGTSAPLSNDLVDPDGGDNANFWGWKDDNTFDDYTIGAPFWMTEVGDFENSMSPYGTYDQNGNVWEWNETIISEMNRGIRGGAFNTTLSHLHAAHRSFLLPTDTHAHLGFRVAEVPEPAAWFLLALGGLACLRRR